MGMPSDENQLLNEARDFVSRFRASLSPEIRAADLTMHSKVPFKAATLREAYFYRMTELSAAACSLYEDKLYLSGLIVTRAVIETLAALYYLKEAVSTFLEKPDIEILDQVLMAGLSGSRHPDAKADGLPSSINIMTMIKHLDRSIPQLENHYNWLSEMAHPNSLGVVNTYARTNAETLTAEFTVDKLSDEILPGTKLLLACLATFEDGYNELAELLSLLNAACNGTAQH